MTTNKVTHINELRTLKRAGTAAKDYRAGKAERYAQFGEFFMMIGEAYFEGEGKAKQEALFELYKQMEEAKITGALPPDNGEFANVVWDMNLPETEE
jgi:hypothetical protein